MGLRESTSRFLGGSSEPDIVGKLKEELKMTRSQEAWLEENIDRLERSISGDDDWRRLGAALRQDFTRAGLDDLIDVSRAMYLSNPLIQRAVNVATYYTWAQGYEFQAAEDRVRDEIVDVQTDNESNRLEIYSHQATLLTDVDQQVDGSVFLALFTDELADVDIRSIPTEQIREIITHPQDYQQVWFYRRCWSQREFDMNTGRMDVKTYDELYPDIRYKPSRQPGSIGGTTVHWEAPVIHQRVGGLKHMTFGIPQTYAALDWARAYKKFLEDWHTVVSSLARFAWKATASKSKAARLKDRLTRRTRSAEMEDADEGSSFHEPAGQMWADKDADLTPINKSGASVGAADAKQSRLMIGAAMDLPDTLLSGDPDQGNLATAKTLDRPTELAFTSRRTLWGDFHARVFRYTYDEKVRRRRMPGRIIRTPDGTFVEPGLDPTVKTIFPPILEHDVKETVGAIVSAATLDGKVDASTIPRDELVRLLGTALGVEDVESMLDDLDTEERDQVEQAVERLVGMVGGGNGSHG